METEFEHLKKMLDRHWNGMMWHGTNLQEVLKGITRQTAFAKPAGFTHNIYEYVNHMLCWRTFTIELLNGNDNYKVELNSETDWQTVYEKTENNWNRALADLEANQQALLAALDKHGDVKLDELVPGKKFKWYALLHGVLHHDIYHSAQISLLKRIAAT